MDAAPPPGPRCGALPRPAPTGPCTPGSCRGRYHTDRHPGTALAVKLAAPAAAALVNALLIALAVLAGLAAVGLVAYIAWQVHRFRHPGAASPAALPPGPGAARSAAPAAAAARDRATQRGPPAPARGIR